MDFRQRLALRKRNRQYLVEPGYAALMGLLLDLGGQEVVLREEPDLEAIVSDGEPFPSEGAKMHSMDPRMCHWNAAKLWKKSGGRIDMVTGWALSADGLWRQHSWGWDGTRVHETTEPRVAYFGTVLKGERALDFYLTNSGKKR